MTSGLGRQRKWAAVSGQVGDAGASGRGAAGRAPCGLIFFQDLLIAQKDTSLKFKKNHRSLASNVMKLFDKVELRGEVNNFPFSSTSKSKSKGF
jgi:hypothetical protein